MKFMSYIILSVFLSAIFISCNKNSNETMQEKSKKSEGKELVRITKEASKEINLKIVEVTEGELTGAITIPAQIVPNQDLEAYVGSWVPGRVSKVFVNIGDNVKKGQTLMLIEGLQIGEIKAQFLKAKANLNYYEANYNRLKTLIEQNVSSQKSFLESKADYDKAKAEFNAEDKRIHSIGLSDSDVEDTKEDQDHLSGRLEIKAPLDGTIIERNVVIGQLVDPNTNSFRIMDRSSVFVDGQIYENDLKRITGKPEIDLTVNSYPENQFKGKLIYISDVVDNEARTIKIRASVSNHDRKLKPGMFTEMHIPTAITARGIIIPSEAIIKDGNDSYVFVVVNDTTFERRNIVTGSALGDYTEVKSGIEKGEEIVVKGGFMLKSEIKKELLEEDE